MLYEAETMGSLERAVVSETAEKAVSVYKESVKSSFSAYALGIACLYRGLDMVKALVECGADFRYPDEAAAAVDEESGFSFYRYTKSGKFKPDFSLMIMGNLEGTDQSFKPIKGIKKLSASQRAEILDYLCNNAEKTGFSAYKILYFSIRDGNEKFYNILKKYQIRIPRESRWIFKNASNFAGNMDCEKFMKVFGMIARELEDEKIRGNMTFYGTYLERVLSPESFRFILEHFDRASMNQTKILKKLIDKEAVSCLAIAAEEGWLKLPRKRDEMIRYATDSGKPESTAWLLEFKNRTADLKAEREKADKKLMRELNADPNSPSELKKLWKFQKREDGTIIIEGYKGSRTEITVPEKIGEDRVTEIGEYAFSPDAKGIREEQRNVRKALTKVTLPDTVVKIGEFAFFKCQALKQVNIPDKLTEISKGMLDITGIENIIIDGNIKKIGGVAFYGCRNLKSVKLCEGVAEIAESAFYFCANLETLELPRSIQKIADFSMPDNPFHGCRKLTALLYKGSYAEQYCERNKINYKYIYDEK